MFAIKNAKKTYEDLDEFVNLCKELKQKFKGFNLTPSFSTFVPKAQTPFQFARKEDTKTLEKKIEYLKKQFAKIGIKARLGSAKWDYIQALLSRGDNTLTPYLINVYKQGGNLGAFKNEYKQFQKDFNYKDSDEIALNEFSIIFFAISLNSFVARLLLLVKTQGFPKPNEELTAVVLLITPKTS